jgi:hypothetical protein
MRIETHEHIGHDRVETVKHRQDDDESGNPDGNADKRHEHDDVDEAHLPL